MYLDQVGCSGNTKWNAGSDNNDLSILDVMISLRSFYRMLKQIIRMRSEAAERPMTDLTDDIPFQPVNIR